MSQNPLLVTTNLMSLSLNPSSSFALRGGDRLVEPSVHYAVDQIGQQSDAERQRAEKYGIGDSTPCRGDAGAEKECGGRSQTRHGHLQAERQRQFVAGEPFDDHFRYGDSADFGPHAEDGETQSGHPHLRLESEEHPSFGKERRNGVGFQKRTSAPSVRSP